MEQRKVLKRGRIKAMTDSNPVRFGTPVDAKCEKCGRAVEAPDTNNQCKCNEAVDPPCDVE